MTARRLAAWPIAAWCGLVALVTATATAADLAPPGPLSAELAPGGGEWVVRVGKRPIVAYAFAPGQIKPYVRELASPRGENILRDSPFDHKHHHALMYGIKVDDANFWEETPGCGHQVPVGVPTSELDTSGGDRPSARFRQRIRWIAAGGKAPLLKLIEDRTLTVTVDEAAGETALAWHAAFQVGPDLGEIVLTGANYHGLGMRFLWPLDTLADHRIDGRKLDLTGTRQDVSAAPWAAIGFDVTERPTTVAVFGSPRNAGGEARFFSMKRPFAYLAATQGLDRAPLRYRSGDRFEIDYLVVVRSGLTPSDELARRRDAWLAACGQPGH